MSRKLKVFLRDAPSGTLEQMKSGQMSFSYGSDAQRPLSLSMPLREEPYGSAACDAFFGGLLPESDNARQLIGKRFGVNGNNNFSLLSVIGHECAGAISVFPLDAPGPPATSNAPPHVLTEKQLAQHIRELPKRPLLAGVEGIRLSLAGAGDKAAVCVVDGVVALPADTAATTHILKPNIGTVGDTVGNEYFCMRLAEKLGLAPAKVEIGRAEDVGFLLVERYDRIVATDGTVQRLHQEDFCQALGVRSATKYQNEGGPGYVDCFELLRRVSRPAVDRIRLSSYIIFNFLVGNMDAHGKNFSLLHEPNVALAPMYDVLATRIYPELSSRLAMKVDKYYESEDIFPRHWKRLCVQSQIGYPGFKRTFLDSCKKITAAAEELRDELKEYQEHRQTFNEIVDHIHRTAQQTATRFSKEAEQPEEVEAT
jgi:serine/threonine-protein kinase HipA